MSKTLFAAAIAVAATLARASNITITSAKAQLGEAMKAVKPPDKLPKGVTIDEFGALTFAADPRAAVFDYDCLAYASTPQQIANICAQLSCDPAGNPVPGGPAPPGWDQGQIWNRFLVPLQRATGYRPDGSAIYEPADGDEKHPAGKWRYPRVRIRARGEAAQAALREFHASGPR